MHLRALVFTLSGGEICAPLRQAFAACGVRASRISAASEFIQLVQRREADLLVLDSTWEIANEVRRADRHCPILLIAPAITEPLLLAAMRAGINDVVPASSSQSELEAAIARLAPLPGHSAHHELLIDGARLVGGSAAMRQARLEIRLVACAATNVLITGETGTGKELAAELIHRNSNRWEQPFVSINCAALPDSLLESELFGHERGAFTGAQAARSGKLQFANGGTVFMDEIGDMDLRAQAKILRAIETRHVQRLGGNNDIPLDIRIVAATNRDLEALVAERRFREDLYYRLNVARLHLPPLRARRDDIPALLQHALADLNRRTGRPAVELEPDLAACLKEYEWPGNVRELRNMIESAYVFCSSRTIGFQDLPAHLRLKLTPAVGKDPDEERNRVLHALDSTEWNRTEAAKVLHWSRMTLYRKMQRYAIEPRRNVMSTAVTA